MKVAVTTPTGNIGRALTRKLLDEKAEVTLLVRNPEKVQEFTSRGAQVKQGSLMDAAFLDQAIAGADALFWLTPPAYTTDDLLAHQQELGRIAAHAIHAQGVSRVVNLSSAGAQMQSGTGPILGLHHVERILEDTPSSITHLRPAYFMENFLMSLDTIKNMNSVFLPIRGERRMPMVATRDIAEVAARRLLDSSWSGRSVLGIHGPEDLSFDQAAQILSERLGRPIAHVPVRPEQAGEAMLQLGINPKIVEVFLEMYACMDTGSLEVEEPRTAETTTPTKFADFVDQVIKPLC